MAYVTITMRAPADAIGRAWCDTCDYPTARFDDTAEATQHSADNPGHLVMVEQSVTDAIITGEAVQFAPHPPKANAPQTTEES
jgi:hypothetical protein